MNFINILLGEDNEGDILLTGEVLIQGKIVKAISVAKDVKEAITYVEKVAPYNESVLPDLIISDIYLPKFNGQEVFKNINARDKFKEIPVVSFTTSLADRDISESYKNYANCFRPKSVIVNDFLKNVTLIENVLISIVHLPTTNHPIK